MRKLLYLPKGTETFDSAYAKCGRRMLTNADADKLLIEAPDVFNGTGPIWTRTIVAYPRSGACFSHSLEYSCRPTTYVLDTSDFRGIRGAALLIEDFELRADGSSALIVPKGKPLLLENFPQESGWFPAHPSGIPLERGEGPERFLCRLEAERVGPVVRGPGPDMKLGRDVFLHHRPTQRLGAIFEEEPASNVVHLPTAARK